ncbi:MAG: hypothetical protein ACTSWI_01890 [Alphaproteobacteria bacterium]
MNAFAQRIGRISLSLIVATTLTASTAFAQGNAGRDYIFLAIAADRGLNCGLMHDWEVASLLSQLERSIQDLAPSDQQALEQTAAEQAAQTPCDDPIVGQWIEAARPGMMTEWLPPNLALYRAYALMTEPPVLFSQIVQETNLLLALDAIDRQFAVFVATGLLAEGEMGWDDYILQIADVAVEIAAAADGAVGTEFDEETAIGFIVDAALIVSLWLADQ